MPSFACSGLGGPSGGNDLPLSDAASDRGGETGTLEDGGSSCGGGTTACGGGVCADLQSDGRNCGRCGRDGLGAGCANGACGVITLVSGLNIPQHIALDAEYVYATLYAENMLTMEFADGKKWRITALTGADKPGAMLLLSRLRLGHPAILGNRRRPHFESRDHGDRPTRVLRGMCSMQ